MLCYILFVTAHIEVFRSS